MMYVSEVTNTGPRWRQAATLDYHRELLTRWISNQVSQVVSGCEKQTQGSTLSSSPRKRLDPDAVQNTSTSTPGVHRIRWSRWTDTTPKSLSQVSSHPPYQVRTVSAVRMWTTVASVLEMLPGLNLKLTALSHNEQHDTPHHRS